MANISKSFNFRNGVNVDDDNLVVNRLGLVGIGTTVPEYELDVYGDLHISQDLIDSNNSAGVNGAFLTKDVDGIVWTTFTPDFIEGIHVQDNGSFLTHAGVAASFTVLNYVLINSQGIGTDTIVPIPDLSLIHI